MLAREIHALVQPIPADMITVDMEDAITESPAPKANCSAIKRSFTDAIPTEPEFEAAHEGTLFLNK